MYKICLLQWKTNLGCKTPTIEIYNWKEVKYKHNTHQETNTNTKDIDQNESKKHATLPLPHPQQQNNVVVSKKRKNTENNIITNMNGEHIDKIIVEEINIDSTRLNNEEKINLAENVFQSTLVGAKKRKGVMGEGEQLVPNNNNNCSSSNNNNNNKNPTRRGRPKKSGRARRKKMNWRCCKSENRKRTKTPNEVMIVASKTKQDDVEEKSFQNHSTKLAPKTWDKSKLKVYSTSIVATNKRWKRAIERATKEKNKRKEQEKKAKITIQTMKKLAKLNTKEIVKLTEKIKVMNKEKRKAQVKQAESNRKMKKMQKKVSSLETRISHMRIQQ